MNLTGLEQKGRKLSLSGQLDAMAVDRLRPELARIAETEQHDVSLDFSDVDFVDSSGIGAVVFMYKRLTSRKLRMTVTGLHGQPLELFRFLRIDKTIPVETSDAAATEFPNAKPAGTS